MVNAKEARRFIFVNLTLLSKVGMGEMSKKNKSRVIANQLMKIMLILFLFHTTQGKLFNITKLISM